jgi:small-conductance mechanosensitive channel
LAAGGIGETIGRLGEGEITITILIEAVIIVVVIYLAVRFFMKRG